MPRKPKKIPQAITEEDFNKITSAILTEPKPKNIGPEIFYFRQFRNCMMFFLMFYLGLRPKECYAAKLDYLNLDKETLFIPAENNKQRNSDFIPLPNFILPILVKYLEVRNSLFKISSWLFPSDNWKHNSHLDTCFVAGVFKRAVKKANLYQIGYIDPNGRKIPTLTPYSLRHSFGSRVYEKTHDIKKTANLLRQYDWQCRSALIYIHTTQNKGRKELLDEIYS